MLKNAIIFHLNSFVYFTVFLFFSAFSCRNIYLHRFLSSTAANFMPKSLNSNLYLGEILLSLFSKVFQYSWVDSEADNQDVRRQASIGIGNYETIMKIKQRIDDFSTNFYKLFISLRRHVCVLRGSWVNEIRLPNESIRTFLLGNWKMVNFSIRFGAFFIHSGNIITISLR